LIGTVWVSVTLGAAIDHAAAPSRDPFALFFGLLSHKIAWPKSATRIAMAARWRSATSAWSAPDAPGIEWALSTLAAVVAVSATVAPASEREPSPSEAARLAAPGRRTADTNSEGGPQEVRGPRTRSHK